MTANFCEDRDFGVRRRFRFQDQRRDESVEAMRQNMMRGARWGWFVVPLALCGCDAAGSATATSGNGKPPAVDRHDRPIRIITTCGMVTDIVRQVAGERATVSALMGEGVDPHLYKPTRNDVKQLMESEVVFYSGLMLEGRMADTFTRVARTGKPVYAVTDGIEESYLREPPEFAGHWDPHVWMDVAAWSQCVGKVAEALAEFDPTGAATYRKNAEAYRAELKKLDEYVRQVISTIPTDQRALITAHDAFGYFSRAYDIPVKSVQGLSTESEAGVDDINKLVDFIVEKKVKAIFVETSVSDKNMRAVVEGAADKGWDVTIGGKLFSDAMGAPHTYEGTYIGMLDHNATTITRALGGEAPEKGFQGKLSRR